MEDSHVGQLTIRQVAVKGLLRWTGGSIQIWLQLDSSWQWVHILSPLKQGTKNYRKNVGKSPRSYSTCAVGSLIVGYQHSLWSKYLQPLVVAIASEPTQVYLA